MAKGLDTNSPNKRKRIVLAVIGVILLIASMGVVPAGVVVHSSDP